MFTAMQQRIREAREEQSGFTLIELLIVIVILGVLAGIVVFAVSAFNNDGKDAACKADAKNVETASEAYYAKNKDTYATAVDGTASDTLVGAGYLREAPSTTNGYTINYDNTTGAVTGKLTCGASCFP
jgi:prepilin-type N-terminal cleavage/methylation domain-containing protein